jgi:hypothetical protein
MTPRRDSLQDTHKRSSGIEAACRPTGWGQGLVKWRGYVRGSVLLKGLDTKRKSVGVASEVVALPRGQSDVSRLGGIRDAGL